MIRLFTATCEKHSTSWCHKSALYGVPSFHISSSRSVFLPVNSQWSYQNRSFPPGLPELFYPDNLLTGQDLLPSCHHCFAPHADLLLHFSVKVLVPLNKIMPVCEFSASFPMCLQNGILSIKTSLSDASRVKASPWLVTPDPEWQEGTRGWTQIICTKYPKSSPRSAVCLTDSRDSAGAGTSEFTHV